MARRQTLGAPALDLEDVLAAVVGSGVELLAQAGELGLTLEEVELGLGDDGLRVPGLEGGHDCVILLVRIHRAGVGIIVILDRGVGVESSLCDIISEERPDLEAGDLLC